MRVRIKEIKSNPSIILRKNKGNEGGYILKTNKFSYIVHLDHKVGKEIVGITTHGVNHENLINFLNKLNIPFKNILTKQNNLIIIRDSEKYFTFEK